MNPEKIPFTTQLIEHAIHNRDLSILDSIRQTESEIANEVHYLCYLQAIKNNDLELAKEIALQCDFTHLYLCAIDGDPLLESPYYPNPFNQVPVLIIPAIDYLKMEGGDPLDANQPAYYDFLDQLEESFADFLGIDPSLTSYLRSLPEEFADMADEEEVSEWLKSKGSDSALTAAAEALLDGDIEWWTSTPLGKQLVIISQTIPDGCSEEEMTIAFHPDKAAYAQEITHIIKAFTERFWDTE
jgi:hypothetical protein